MNINFRLVNLNKVTSIGISVLLLLFVVFTQACSSGGGGDPQGQTGNPQDPGGNQNDNSDNSSNPSPEPAANLLGTWLLSCQQTSFTTELVVDATSYDATTTTYTDGTCVDPLFTDVYSNTYLTGQSVTSTNGLPATELDVTLTTVERTLHTDIMVMGYNASTSCGYSDWEIDVPKDITGRDCGSFASGCTSDSTSTVCDAAGTTTYTIYGVNDTGTQLNFGYPTTGRDGTTPAARMNTLFTIIPFVKQ